MSEEHNVLTGKFLQEFIDTLQDRANRPIIGEPDSAMQYGMINNMAYAYVLKEVRKHLEKGGEGINEDTLNQIINSYANPRIKTDLPAHSQFLSMKIELELLHSYCMTAQKRGEREEIEYYKKDARDYEGISLAPDAEQYLLAELDLAEQKTRHSTIRISIAEALANNRKTKLEKDIAADSEPGSALAAYKFEEALKETASETGLPLPPQYRGRPRG